MASSAWQARNARARALGYRNYYDYRAHNYGSRSASAPQARGEELARLRGHRGARDLERDMRRGRVAALTPLRPERDPKTGQIRRQELEVTYADGSQKTFVLRGASLDPEKIRDLEAAAGAGGLGPTQIVGSPPRRRQPSLEDLELEDLEREELEDMLELSDAELGDRFGFSAEEIAELRAEYGGPDDDEWEEVAIPF